MGMEQIDMFSFVDNLNKDPIINTTCVVMDGECKDVAWNELFDAEKYDQLMCVTYVSSASFLSRAIDKFKNVKVIIGIEKADVRKAIAESINARVMQEGTKFFEELPDTGKDKLIERSLEVRYSKTEYIIHSKLYLLSNSESGENRLIFGSANLTNTAFNNAVHQYEDIMVSDNNLMFDIYKKRFQHIYSITEDYVPGEVINKYKEGKLISIVDFTPEERTEEIIEILKKENIVPVCNETILKCVQEAQSENEKEITETKATFEVIVAAGKKKRGDKNGNYTIKNAQELESSKGKIIDILFRHTKTEMNMQRFSLTFNDTDKKQYIIFPKNDDCTEARAPEVFDRKATREEIRSSMENLMQFLMAYKKFVSDTEDGDENLSRILEAIMYAFASAYIFKLRQENTGSKSDIPIMLVIGGRAASGKSNLLAYIDRILSGRQLLVEQHYIQYKQIEKRDTVGELFMTDNTYPLLVDEVPPAFFNSKSTNKGEELIKYLSNTLDSKHPVMICTTNTGGFSIPAQVARRIYFLKVDACFNEKYKSEANAYYEDVMANASNILFRDFCSKMGELIKTNSSLFGDDSADYLGIVRKIFREYFIISKMEIPACFPNQLYRDYEYRGKNMWKTLYQQTKDRFVYSPKKGEKEATFTLNLKDMTTGVKDVQVYMNYLRQDILVEEAGMYVVLKADAFCDWIGVKNVSWLERMRRKRR